MFSNVDAINCLPGDESDSRQRAAAAVMQQLVNYRTDRASGKAAIPWFMVAMGSRQDANLHGVCVSKQCWRLELKKQGTEVVSLQQGEDEDAPYEEVKRDVWVADIDRPDVQLIPPENVVIDPAADWTDPIQSAAYVILKWPMQLEEIQRKMDHPIKPWKKVSNAKY